VSDEDSFGRNESTYPQGVGATIATIATNTGFALNVHYANAGSSTIPGHLSARRQARHHHAAGVLFLNQISLTSCAFHFRLLSRASISDPVISFMGMSASHTHARMQDHASYPRCIFPECFPCTSAVRKLDLRLAVRASLR
jgi:hypothetical protein